MPKVKLKTHSGAAKRFRKTGTGKVVRGHAFARHILTTKTTKKKRKMDKDAGHGQVRYQEDEADDPVLETSR